MKTTFPPFFSLNLSVQVGAEWASGLILRCFNFGFHFSFLLKNK